MIWFRSIIRLEMSFCSDLIENTVTCLEKTKTAQNSPKCRLKILVTEKIYKIYPSIRCTRWPEAWPWRVGWHPRWRTDSCPLPGRRPVSAISANSRIQNLWKMTPFLSCVNYLNCCTKRETSVFGTSGSLSEYETEFYTSRLCDCW